LSAIVDAKILCTVAQVLDLLVDRLLFDHRRLQEAPADSDELKTTGPYVEQARKKLEELLAHITSKVTNQHEIWAVYAKYHEGFGNKEKVRVVHYICRMWLAQ
jgi:hypothetical protein